MYRRDNFPKQVGILILFSTYFLVTVFSRSIFESQDFLHASELRLASVPTLYGSNSKCMLEVPTRLTLEHSNQHIRGNGTNEHWMRYEVCCDGYKRYEYDWNLCVPDCGKKCENGLCIAPGDCRCFPGHIKNYDGECVTTCPLGCLNGRCSYDGRCTCDYGYTLDISEKFCKPICREECKSNQNCTRPERCECLQGWKVNIYTGECMSTCNPDCGEHGYCNHLNNCVCKKGYSPKRGVCQANDCKLVCENGMCLHGNVCQCYPGYLYDQDLTSCIPQCTNCENGTCIEPENCKCFKGYAMINGICRPVCSRGCIGGICVGPEHCNCEYGKVDKLGYCRKYGEDGCTLQIDGTCLRWAVVTPHN